MAVTPRTIRTLAALLSAPLLVLAAACGDDGDSLFSDAQRDGDASGETGGTAQAPAGFEASPTYLRSVAETSSAEAYRFDMWMGFGTTDVDTSGPPFVTGEQDGLREYMSMDFGLWIAEMGAQVGETVPPEIAGIDMTVEVVVDATDFYLRMPFMAEMADEVPPFAGPEADLMVAFANWVYIDLARLNDVELEDLESLWGDQNVDPREFIDVLTGAQGARELEPIEVRGQMMHGIAAEVTNRDLLEADGVDIDEFVSLFPEEEDLLDTTVDMGVWVDSDGYVGRLSWTLDITQMVGVDGIEPHDVAEMESVFGAASMTFVVDLYDYGDPGISIEIPADASDVTDDIGLLSPEF
jgi:hypothetical protein